MKNSTTSSTHSLRQGYHQIDTVLLRLFQEGDPASFEKIYYRWNKPIYNLMLKITHSVPDSEEITQEVFVRLWNMRESVDPERNFGALAFTIARRIAIDMYRQRGHLKVVVPDEPEDGVSGDRSPQEILEEREEALLLDIAIESMPSRQREVFSMYYYQNLSPKEIATRTGLSYDNVRRQIYNAKRDLRGVVMLISMFLLSQ